LVLADKAAKPLTELPCTLFQSWVFEHLTRFYSPRRPAEIHQAEYTKRGKRHFQVQD
jgi:hypothetical protein